MAYCTPQDVRVYIPLITEQAFSDSKVQTFIDKAEAVVNGSLRGLYEVPFGTAPQIIKDITAEYTAYLVYRTVMSDNSPNSSEYAQELKKSSETKLEMLKQGELAIEDQAGENLVGSVKQDSPYFSMDDVTPWQT
ncbi:DUF1320 family protein (plasmid) [Halobacillus litoralis]|uniref:phage protein Gp36 family protein n=1 Tax=Halobacillus litoralis TaxID=45668 RepID=UPI001CFC5976|nr:phage protein Gp36 family protein [Halobacillus litoralis]WLR49590.1 DUF1320 family protein [Halobacillus litoralis]